MSKQTKKQPLVTVVMPVFNTAAYVKEAVESIIVQTYPNWELIIVDDLSTDGSFQLAKKLAKQHQNVSVYRNGKHRGVSGAANLALSQAKGQLIARMDADDIAYPTRLEKQVAYLLQNPHVVAIGTQCEIIDNEGASTGKKVFPLDHQTIQEMMFYSIPLQQPTLMVNTAKLPSDFIWYNETYNSAEEVELLFKLFQHGEVHNLPDTLHQYRIHGKNVSLKNPKQTFFLTFKTRIQAISKYRYRPTLPGMVVTLAQLITVALLPTKYIYPVYSTLRGLKNQGKLTLNRFAGINLL